MIWTCRAAWLAYSGLCLYEPLDTDAPCFFLLDLYNGQHLVLCEIPRIQPINPEKLN